MGLFSDDYLRLDVAMDFRVLPRAGSVSGRGGIAWHDLKRHPALDGTRCRIALACLLYGRILMAHAETRDELFERVGRASVRHLLVGEPAAFDEWVLRAGDGEFGIWPWDPGDPADLQGARTYAATLKGDKRGVWIHLKMAWGLERVLAPASVLITVGSLSRGLGAEDRVLLGRCIGAMQAHYGTAAAAGGLRSDTRAVAAAYPLLAGAAAGL